MNNPTPGDMSDEGQYDHQAAEASAKRFVRLQIHEQDHLCTRCIHAPICHVVTAIKYIGGEGDVTISACGAFQEPGPTLAEMMAMTEDEDNSDEELIKDRR